MDDRRFGAEITEVPDEARLRLSGDLNARADETLADAYGQVAALGSRRISLDFLVTHRFALDDWAIGLTEHYQEIFRITRLSDFMEIVEGDAA